VIAPLATDTTAAWFGVIGVIVGALVTGVVSFALERCRQRREYRLSLQLVKADIEDVLRVTKDALDHEKWPPGLGRKDWVTPWSVRCGPLASGMKADAFKTVATAFAYTQQVESGLATKGDQAFDEEPESPVGSRDKEFFLDVKDAFKRALDTFR